MKARGLVSMNACVYAGVCSGFRSFQNVIDMTCQLAGALEGR